MSENNHGGKQSSPATAGPFDKTDSDLRIEALRQAADIWKHWDDIGHPDGDDTLIDLAQSFHDFLTGRHRSSTVPFSADTIRAFG